MAVGFRQSRFKRIELLGYAAIVSWVVLNSFRHPVYNWDLIGYLAAIAAIDRHQPQEIHRATFEQLERSLPADRLQGLKYGNTYRQAVFENPKYLVQQIPYHSIKPRLIKDPPYRHSLGVNGRRRVMENFSLYSCVKKHLDWCEEVLTRPRGLLGKAAADGRV